MTSPFSPLPDNLPDHRTAERLLDILHQLEGAVTSGAAGHPAQSSAQPSAEPGELANLRAENARLQKRRKQALQRLDALIQQVQQQFELSLQAEPTQEPSA